MDTFDNEKDILLDHDYDGIHELDNHLPPWWVYLFYLTIVWRAVYMLYFHVFNAGDTSTEEYYKEIDPKWSRAMGHPPALKKADATTDASAAFLTDAKNIADGRQVFQTNCIACHGANGEGGVGPNLTDDYWLHGNTASSIIGSITHGYPDKGMIAWGQVLPPDQIKQVAGFIRTLHGTNPANAKAPQGDKLALQ